LRAVATLEATKGAVVLAAGFGLLEILHLGAQQLAEEVVRNFHLNPASRYPRIFLHLAERATPANLWPLAFGAAAYSALRFTEAYGLWRQRRWAEWLSVVSGIIYIPFEIWELGRGVTGLKLSMLGLNLVVVGYLISVMRARKATSGAPD
jgi:uncharacterized membrane protein (DUF2068 family)